MTVLHAHEEPGASLLRDAWRWHCWQPPWLPGRIRGRIKRWALGRYTRPVVCRLDTGQRFVARPDDFVQCEIGITGSWEGLIYQAVKGLVPPGSTVLDVGAHVGYSAMLFAEWVGPDGRVHCFEPVPAHASQIEDNARLNGYERRLSVRRLAVGDRRGRASFHHDVTQNTGMGSLVPRPTQGVTVDVDMQALDEWRAEARVGPVALVKIDVEGAEGLVVRGMAKGLGAGDYAALLVEIHDRELEQFGTPLGELLETLGAAGYRLLHWEDSGGFVPGAAPGHVCYLLAIASSAPVPARGAAW
ncbi:MAG TPA: FkbM family methyltransferase [Candidatus Bathyarchaeia archaeon]|nr:FkbM family methyltransferase [Candidatus Bathyarchaeia archaeon]